ncbi:Ku protein [Caulobacter sp. D4A]|uniref:non-homologous end joining protein Ku n=1 Tax=unclassified Caulobacter TaxID=2648921 RepID=UPI000D738B58|nr:MULTISPECIES: Ku protein [unclassified Caulobacter]PXA78628.1 Ku protein [Caulobacter sp. D4A]PXA87915.1 Ku protein [Caulobacter sp. D5]
MAYRPTWQGHLRLSLVTCPVALYTATDSGGEVHFNLINPKTNNRIKMITTDPDTGPIERSELVKGYEVYKGEYILLSQDEINAVKLESTKTIDIERFVPAEEIDRVYWDNPYYLAPDGKLAQEAFAVIREAMAKSGQIALGRVVMSTRERLLALEPRGKGILAYTLRTDAEVRKESEIFDAISDKAPDKAMIAIAEKIIEQQEGPFDPSQFVDRYEEALKDLIEAKQKGHKVEKVAEPEDTNVVDLMAALRASLGGKAPASAKPEAKTKPRAKSATSAKTKGAAKAAPAHKSRKAS